MPRGHRPRLSPVLAPAGTRRPPAGGMQRRKAGRALTIAGKQRRSTGKPCHFAGKRPRSTGVERRFAGNQSFSTGIHRALAGNQCVSTGKQWLIAGKQRLSTGKQRRRAGKQRLSNGKQRLADGNGRRCAVGIRRRKGIPVSDARRATLAGLILSESKRRQRISPQMNTNLPIRSARTRLPATERQFPGTPGGTHRIMRCPMMPRGARWMKAIGPRETLPSTHTARDCFT